MEKETDSEYSIGHYGENYNKNKSLSSNKFKKLIFYTSKIFVIFFYYKKNIQPFINMAKYIKKLKFIAENDYRYNNELYHSLKLNLLRLGEYFDNSNDVNFKTDIINTTEKYYVYIY